MKTASRKYTLILAIIIELYLIIQPAIAVIQRGIQTQPLYWLTAAVATGLAYLTYRIHVSNVSYYKVYKKGNPRNNLAFLIIMMVAVGVPIVAYNMKIDSLRPISGGTYFYILATNTIYLYQIIRKPQAVIGDTKYASKGLLLAITIPALLLIIIFLIVFGILTCLGKI